jgi:dihydroneopterin aldolase
MCSETDVAPSPPASSSSGRGRIASLKVFVRGLRLQAEIGVYEHEYGRTQPLVVDVEMEVEGGGWERIADTINYETIAAMAKVVASEGHFQLVEGFADRLGLACLEDPRVTSVRVRVEKPEALAAVADAAGAELLLVRD